MSNGNKKDENEVEETDIPDVSGGFNPLGGDGYIPLPVGDVETPYPRFPGGPIVKIDPPVKPTLD